VPQIVSVPNQYGQLQPLETRLLDALHGAIRHQQEDITIIAAPGAHRRIRATFLRWLLLEAIPRTRLPIARLQLEGATIDGRLDLRSCTLLIRPSFHNCSFNLPIDLTEATVPGLEIIGGQVQAMRADRLTVLGSLLICAAAETPPLHSRIVIAGAVRLNGATVRGNLDMEGADLGAELAGDRGNLPPSTITPTYRMRTDTTPALDGARPPVPAALRAVWISLEADGLSVEGHARFVWPFEAAGELRLDGCTISRNLDCSGARLRNPGGYTLSAAGARIAGTLYLGSPFHDRHIANNPRFNSCGMVRVDGARIDGDLDCSDGHFLATACQPGWDETIGIENDLFALRASGVVVGANARLAGRFVAEGNVTLLNATIGSDLICHGARFGFAGGEALCCDGIDIAGDVFLERVWTDGLLRFALATVRQGFYVRETHFDCSRPGLSLLRRREYSKFRIPEEMRLGRRQGAVEYACGIYADDAKIAGNFAWRRVTRQPEIIRGEYAFCLHISGARTDSVQDDLASWDRLDRFDITNCLYRSIAGLFHEEERDPLRLDLYITKRLALLDRAYAPRSLERSWLTRSRVGLPTREEAIDRFKPQPYLQLAKVLRAAGLDASADDAVVHLERNRTRYGGFSCTHFALRWVFLELLLKYGFGWQRPAWTLLGWAAVSALVFQMAYSWGHIQPTWHNKKSLIDDADLAVPHVPFNAAIFALDTLVPLVNLDQKENWEVEPMSDHLLNQKDQPKTWNAAVSFLGILHSMPDRFAAWLIVINKFFGWLLTTLFAGGVTGVLRGGKEPPELSGGE
jgi:hypothetical protein